MNVNVFKRVFDDAHAHFLPIFSLSSLSNRHYSVWIGQIGCFSVKWQQQQQIMPMMPSQEIYEMGIYLEGQWYMHIQGTQGMARAQWPLSITISYIEWIYIHAQSSASFAPPHSVVFITPAEKQQHYYELSMWMSRRIPTGTLILNGHACCVV